MARLISKRGKALLGFIETHRMTLSVLILILLSVAIVLVATSCINHAPSVISLSADPDVVTPGDTCTITCVASDPDGDSLTYTWTEDGAIMAGTGNTIAWTAPYHEGTFIVGIRVRDGRGGVYSEDCVVAVVLGRLCEIGTPCLDDSGMTVTMSAITVSAYTSITEYRIDYVLENLTPDQVIDEGRFVARFESGPALNQSGFFLRLQPGQSVNRSYAWKVLKAEEDPIYLIEYEGGNFGTTPDATKLKWFVP